VADQRIENGKRWIDGQMKAEIVSMHLQRDTWKLIQAIIEDHGALPDSYCREFVRDTYAITQAVAVRRQVDTHRDAARLGKLISEIGDDASGLTREFWTVSGGRAIASNSCSLKLVGRSSTATKRVIT
jgi:hypothetical protein